MDETQRDQSLRALGQALAQRRLLGPTRLLLDIVMPVGFIASQMATFAQPFVPHGRWRMYVRAFEAEQSWSLFRRIVDQQR